jgi:hypothetical protein
MVILNEGRCRSGARVELLKMKAFKEMAAPVFEQFRFDQQDASQGCGLHSHGHMLSSRGTDG